MFAAIVHAFPSLPLHSVPRFLPSLPEDVYHTNLLKVKYVDLLPDIPFL